MTRVGQTLTAQSLSDFEWIIINDGGCKADLNAALEQFTALKPHIIHHPSSYGRGHAAARGLDAATGTYAIFHDDDDWLSPNALEVLSQKLVENPDAVAVTCGHLIHRETISDGDILPKGRPKEVRWTFPPLLQDVAYANSILTIATMFRRDKAIACGGVNPKLAALEDWDLWLRLLLEGDMVICSEVLAHQSVRELTKGDQAQSTRDAHIQALNQIRNHYLRQDIKSGSASLGALINPHNRHEFDRLSNLLGKLQAIRNVFRLRG